VTNPLTQLHRAIVDHFDLEELRTLCYDLGVNYDDLRGEALSGKARELILKMGRKRQLDELLSLLARTRPNLPREIVLADPDTLDELYAALPSFEDTSLPAPPAPGASPFEGLHHFDQADAHLFFGREALTAKLVGQLRAQRFLAVVGASGSGKSSVVRAGLIPALQRGELLSDGTPPPDGSADESRILTAGADGTVRLWYTRMEDLLEEACRQVPRNMTQGEWRRFMKGQPYRETCPGKLVPGWDE
jgi:hypothetical protein